jgi:hypothetical protein
LSITTTSPGRSLAVVSWSGICGLGSIEIGSLGPINTLPLDHKSGYPESQLGFFPDINKPPLEHLAMILDVYRFGVARQLADRHIERPELRRGGRRGGVYPEGRLGCRE